MTATTMTPMGYLNEAYDGVEHIVLGKGEDGTVYYVDIKRCLSVAESDAAERAIVNIEMEEQPDGKTKSKMRPDMVANTRELVVASIVDWNLTDERDQLLGLHPIDVLRASVARIPQRDFDTIAKRVRELNGERTKEDEARFPEGPERGAAGGEIDEPDDHQVLPGGEHMAAVGAAPGPAAAD